tara:strand:- start:3176 stop:3673 length:498 start_codon:yes stop_codon:yes gene_type:complete
MAVSTSVKVRRDGIIKLTDGTPISLVVTYEDGNFSANTLGANEDRIVVRDRGTIVGLRKGDDQVGTLSFSVHFREFTNAGAGILLDFINQTQGATNLVSTGGAGFEQFLCTVAMEIDGAPDLGDNADGIATFAKVLLTADFSEGDPDVLNVQGEVYGGVTYTGQT